MDINGPVVVFITSDDQPLINNVINRDSSTIVAGPGLTFIDTQPQILGDTVGLTSSSGSSSGSTTTTLTISPALASVIISGAAASASALPSPS